MAEPAVLLPCQYVATAAPRLVFELALVAAILEDALRSVSRSNRSGARRREFAEARDWLLDDDQTWPFAFRNVCDLLGLDASALRESLRERLEPRRRPCQPNRRSPRSPIEEALPLTQPGAALLRLVLFLSVVGLGALTLWVSAGHAQ